MPTQSGSDCGHRHHSAYRLGQEERNHDDRLRARAERKEGLSPHDAIAKPRCYASVRFS